MPIRYKLTHTAITDQGGVQGGEVVTGADDGNTGDGLVVVDTGQLDVGRVVGDVHQGGVHHLVVDGVLGGVAQTAGTGVQIVDEERAHLALLDDVGGLAVTLADQLGGLTGVAGLELTGRHDDGGDAELLEGQLGLEGLALALATPDTQDEGDLRSRRGQGISASSSYKDGPLLSRNDLISLWGGQVLALILGSSMKFLAMWMVILSRKAGEM